MRGSTAVLALLLVALTGAVAAHAESGTPNLLSPQAWNSKTPDLQGEVRIFGGDNSYSWSLGTALALGPGQEVDLAYNTLNNTTRGLVGGVTRESHWNAITLAWKCQMPTQSCGCTWALIPSVDFSTRGPEAKVSGSSEVFQGQATIPGLALAAEHPWGRATVLLEPKIVWFGDSVTAGSTSIDGFGTVVTLGAGLRYPAGTGTLVGDVSFCLAGDNTVDRESGAVDKGAAWSVGWSEPLDGRNRSTFSVFLTDTAGPSVAQSVVGSPGTGSDGGVGAGLRLNGTF